MQAKPITTTATTASVKKVPLPKSEEGVKKEIKEKKKEAKRQKKEEKKNKNKNKQGVEITPEEGHRVTVEVTLYLCATVWRWVYGGVWMCGYVMLESVTAHS